MNDFSYKKLIVWQKGMLLLKAIYVLTEKLPKGEEYILKSQLRRAAVSVVSNIAEGSARKSIAERKRFYEIARSSGIEIDAQLEVAVLLNYVTDLNCEETNGLLLEIFKMLSKMVEDQEHRKL
ncbi:MAG: four helix bundle protein [Ferruginibacter sp.]